jgi:phosphopentomutase
MALERVILLVLDSVGAGEAPDAADYGDAGANTLGNTARHVGGLRLPTLQELGLGHITGIDGVPPTLRPRGAFGKLAETSAGKDTTTGHWEIAGLCVERPFALYPHGFPPEILDPFCAATGRGVLGNRHASGTTILDELGEEHVRTGKLIVYTSGDSVFQIAAHEQVVPVEELYRICEVARSIVNPYRVGRVIARPFVGDGRGRFTRTYNRKDFSLAPPEETVLDAVAAADLPVVGVGKIHDIYAGHGITENLHSEGNADGMAQTIAALDRVDRGLIMTNLVDFDMLYGHRRDPAGYARCLQEFDAQLAALAARLRPDRDLVLITADHGTDPTMPGSDHTREYVPLIAFGPARAAGVDLGTRGTFADVGATVAELFGVDAPEQGESFLAAVAPP